MAKDEPKLELSDAEMERRLQAKQTAKIAECQRELTAVLERHGVTLQVVQVTLDGQPLKPEIRIVPVQKS